MSFFQFLSFNAKLEKVHFRVLKSIFQDLIHLVKVKSMQRSGTEAIRTQIQPSKPKRKITKITNSQNTKRTRSSECAAISQKVATQQPKPNKNNMSRRKVKRYRNSDTKHAT